MNRCTPRTSSPLLSALVLALAALTSALPAASQAQVVKREFPVAAKRGVLVVTAPPQVTLNGNPETLSPGARVRGPNNLVVMTGAIVGQQYVVNYLRDAAGAISEAWILTPDEAAEKRAGMPPARNFFFSSEDKPKDGIAPVDHPYVPGK